MSNVVVFGANGRTGHLIVREALRLGHDVTAAVRTPDRFPSVPTGDLSAEGSLSVVKADVRDPGSVQAAVKGRDVVISAIGPEGRHSHNLYSDAARAFVAAMETTGADRLIAITSSGVRQGDPNFPWWFRNLLSPLVRELYDDMRLMETAVRQSGVDWTFVRPGHLQDDPPTGTYRVLDGANPKGGWKLTRTDLARFIARELSVRQWSRATPTLAQ
jgi:putative NADH-flavin reductase